MSNEVLNYCIKGKWAGHYFEKQSTVTKQSKIVILQLKTKVHLSLENLFPPVKTLPQCEAVKTKGYAQNKFKIVVTSSITFGPLSKTRLMIVHFIFVDSSKTGQVQWNCSV